MNNPGSMEQLRTWLAKDAGLVAFWVCQGQPTFDLLPEITTSPVPREKILHTVTFVLGLIRPTGGHLLPFLGRSTLQLRHPSACTEVQCPPAAYYPSEEIGRVRRDLADMRESDENES